MKNRTKVAAVAIALMASSAMALMPDAGTLSTSVQARFQYVVGPTPGDFSSVGEYLIATTPWMSGSIMDSIMSL